MDTPTQLSTVRLTWDGERRFDAGRLGGPTNRLDGDALTGPSPVDALISALAACSAIDLVDILAKRRTPVSSLVIDAVGARAHTIPKRVTAVDLTFHVNGDGIDRSHAERAVELAVTKYCSVRDTLDAELPIRYVVALNGVAGATITAGGHRPA